VELTNDNTRYRRVILCLTESCPNDAHLENGLCIRCHERKKDPCGYGKFAVGGLEVRGYRRKDGYIQISMRGRRKFLHRIIMELHIGRDLTAEEVVHHKDGNKENNHISNLELLTAEEHNALHQKEYWENWKKSLKPGNSEESKLCSKCGVSFPRNHFPYKSKTKQRSNCRACESIRMSEYHRKIKAQIRLLDD